MDVLERALTAVQHREPDKVPFVPLVYSMILKDYNRQTEKEYYHDFRSQLEAKVAFQRRFPELMGPPACHFCFPEAPHNVGGVATAFGGKISWMEEAPPWVSECPVKEPEDVDRLVSAGVPDPRKTGMTAKFLEGLRYFVDWFPRDLRTRYGYIDGNIGPDCMFVEGAAVAMGYDKFLVWLFLHPQEVKKWLRLVTDWYLELCEAIGEITGPPKYLWIPDHSPSFVGKEQFKEFILPHFNEVLGKYKQVAREGGWRVWHCEGSCRHNLDGIDLIDAEVWHFGAQDDPALCKEKTHFCLMGNLHPPGVLLKGTTEEVEDETKQVISKAGKGGGLWLSGGGGCAPGTPFRNFEAVLRAIDKHGRYPLRE